MRVLVVRLSALGDVAMTVPVIYGVAAANPDVRFTVVTRPFMAQLFVGRPENVDVLGVEPRSGMWSVLRRLAHMGITHVADLHNVSRSWIIDAWMLLHGKRVCMVDKMRSERRRVLRCGAQAPGFTSRYADVFCRLGLAAPVPAQVVRSLKARKDSLVVGLAPFARYRSKIYPPEQMRRVAELLVQAGHRVLLFGARGKEAEVLEQWEREIAGATSVAGRHALPDELEIMRGLDVMVSMDSANQHLASLVGTRVVTVWGGTTPACGFAPWGQSAADSVVAGLPCQPCTIAGCERCPQGNGFACMRSLTPEMIVDRVLL